MRTLPDPFGIPGPSFMPSLSARTLPKFYPPDFEPTYNADPNPSGRRLAPCARQPNGKEQPRVSASRPAGHSPPGGKIVSFGLLGDQALKFYHNPPGRTIPNRVSERTEGHGRLQFHRAVVRFFFTTEHTESGFAGHRRRLGKDVVPTLQPQPCHRGGTRSVASARLPTYPFLTQKWYRPGARCTRAALGAGRPNAGGPQRVTTEGGDGRMDTGDNTKTHVNVDPINCVLPTNAPHTALPCVACGPGATAPGPHAIRRFRASRTGP